MQKRRLLIANSLVALLSACQWVDNTGVQSDTHSTLAPVVRGVEETRTDLDFATLARNYTSPISVEGWEQIAEGKLSECSSLIDLAVSANSLQEACSPTEDSCEIFVVPAPDGNPDSNQGSNGESNNQLMTVLPPRLSSPVGVKYRWYLRDGNGKQQSHDTTLCIDAINNPPAAINDSFTIALVDQLVVEGIVYDANCKISSGQTSLLANDGDDHHFSMGPCLRAELLQSPQHATNDFVGSFTEAGGFVYVPDPNRNSPADAFTYRVYDGTNYSDTATVSILTDTDEYEPNSTNDVFDINKNSSDNRVYPLINDKDPFGTQLTLAEISTPLNKGGTVTIIPGFTLVYSPKTGFRGNETMWYRVQNVYGLEDWARVIFRVR